MLTAEDRMEISVLSDMGTAFGRLHSGLGVRGTRYGAICAAARRLHAVSRRRSEWRSSIRLRIISAGGFWRRRRM